MKIAPTKNSINITMDDKLMEIYSTLFCITIGVREGLDADVIERSLSFVCDELFQIKEVMSPTLQHIIYKRTIESA